MPREALLTQTLVELADSLVEDFDVVDLLTLLADRCVEVVDVAAAELMLASADGELRVLASSSEAMRVLELFEAQADEGPCVDAYRSGLPVVNLTIDEANSHWPRFAPKAAVAGFRSVHALPMRLRGDSIGALNLFQSEEGRLDDADVAAAQALADVATIAILAHRAARDAPDPERAAHPGPQHEDRDRAGQGRGGRASRSRHGGCVHSFATARQKPPAPAHRRRICSEHQGTCGDRSRRVTRPLSCRCRSSAEVKYRGTRRPSRVG